MNPNTPQYQAIHFLTGIASCALCGASMLDTGLHYACPEQTAQGPDQCATLPVRCGQLDRMVVQFLVDTLVTPDVLNLQAELLAEDSAQESHRQQQVLEESRSAITGLNQHAETLLSQVEHGGKTYQQVDAQVMETGRARTEQEAQATNAQDQLERQSYLADQDWVSSSTLDAETYLHPDTLEGSRLFFHSFIDAVLIGPESAVIKYSIAPTEFEPTAGSYVHEINLVHEHTVAEILVCPGDSPLRRNAEVCACGAQRTVDLEGNPTDGWRIWKPIPDQT